MSRNNTGNPIGSKAFPDFEDNVKNLDEAVNSEQDAWSDRLGKSRLTWAGMENQFDADQAVREQEFDAGQVSREQRFRAFIASSGYQFAGEYAAGIEITQYNQIIRDENGEFWRVSGQVDLPYITTGAGVPEDDALVPAGDAVLRQDLANPDMGAAMVSLPGNLPGTVPRNVADWALESRSIFEWLSTDEKNSVRNRDFSIDLTEAFQRAFTSGVEYLDLHDFLYRVDGTVMLPSSGIIVSGINWGVMRGPGVVNNGGKMFHGIDVSGTIKFENGTLIGNVVRHGPGFDNLASGLALDKADRLELVNTNACGFSVGIRPLHLQSMSISGGEFSRNSLVGVSSMANNVVIDGARIFGNGFVESSGLSHDLYLMNGTGGVIRNCYIGDPVDPTSSSFALRYDESDSVEGFTDCANWKIHDNHIHAGGVSIRSDPGVTVDRRKPPRDIDVFDNTFSGGAGLRWDEPQNCRSWGNKGLERYSVGVASTYPGYEVGLISEDDGCAGVYTSSLTGKRFESRDSVVFKGTTINNGDGYAFSEIEGYGGVTACTIIDPVITGSGEPFDPASLSRYQVSLEIPVKASHSLRHMSREDMPETAIASGGVYTPNNHTSSSQILQVRFNGLTGTIAAPVVSASGMTLGLLLRLVTPAGSAVITFDGVYKLSEATAAALGTNASGQYMYLEFVYLNGAWRQLGDSSWTVA